MKQRIDASAPLVSIIVPAFNAERTLCQALESAAAQSWRKFEIIIVDDGSTDATAAIAREFCAREPRARLVQQSNGGVAAARNRGIDEAIGEWIAPLDADDLWHPEKIDRQLAAADKDRDAGLIYNWSRLIDAAARVIGSTPAVHFKGNVLSDHLAWNFIGNGSTPLIRRDLLKDLRYQSAVDGCADFMLQLRLATKTRFAVAPAFLTAYRVTDENMSADTMRMIRDHVEMYRLLSPHLPERERRQANRQMARWQTVEALVLLRRGRVLQSCTSMASALRKASASALRAMFDQLGRRRRPGLAPAGQSSSKAFLEFDPREPFTSS